MADDTTPQVLKQPVRREAPPKYPYMFRRIYHCGHPDEFIEVSKPPEGNRVEDTVVSQSDYEKSAALLEGRHMYTLERCQSCALKYRAQHQKTRQEARPRPLTSYQSEVLALNRGTSESKNGFERVLSWWKDGGVDPQRTLHPYALETDHAHDLQIVHTTNRSSCDEALRVVVVSSDPQELTGHIEDSESPPHLRGGGCQSPHAPNHICDSNQTHQREVWACIREVDEAHAPVTLPWPLRCNQGLETSSSRRTLSGSSSVLDWLVPYLVGSPDSQTINKDDDLDQREEFELQTHFPFNDIIWSDFSNTGDAGDFNSGRDTHSVEYSSTLASEKSTSTFSLDRTKKYVGAPKSPLPPEQHLTPQQRTREKYMFENRAYVKDGNFQSRFSPYSSDDSSTSNSVDISWARAKTRWRWKRTQKKIKGDLEPPSTNMPKSDSLWRRLSMNTIRNAVAKNKEASNQCEMLGPERNVVLDEAQSYSSTYDGVLDWTTRTMDTVSTIMTVGVSSSEHNVYAARSYGNDPGPSVSDARSARSRDSIYSQDSHKESLPLLVTKRVLSEPVKTMADDGAAIGFVRKSA